MVTKGGRIFGAGLILFMFAHQFLFEHVSFLLFLLDLLGLLCVLVQFDDPDDADQFHDSDCPGGGA